MTGPDTTEAPPAAQATAEPRGTRPSARPRPRRLGSVAFVGAGPGDPGLLTLRAAELLAAADVVVVDHLARREVLTRHARPDVEVVDAAFGEDGAPLTQAVRAKLVVAAARRATTVVRLLDGEAGCFDGLAEEAAACAKAGVPFEVVPGVSTTAAVPAYAGVPLTDAKVRGVHLIGLPDARTDWSAHADPATTLVLTSALDLGEVAARLIAAGRAPATPVAVTRCGTTTEQQTVVGTLQEAATGGPVAQLPGPSVTVVGPTVALRGKLSWYETKPLFAWRVLVPRTKEQAGQLSAALRAHGAVPEEVPTISVEPPRTPQQMEKGIKGLVTGRYEWVAFTSRNAVRAVRERFEEFGLDARAFAGIKVAAVGGQTASDLRAWGIEPDLVPSGEQSARGLVEDWPAYDDVLDPIDRVFLPRADIATETLVAGLRELGWEVDDVTAYRTVRAAPPAAPVREAIKSGGYDAVLFTSSSTVRNLVGIAGKPHPSTVIACIGPATAKTAEEHGLRVDVLAPEPTVTDLAGALAEYGTALRAGASEAGEEVLRPSQRRTAARRRAT